MESEDFLYDERSNFLQSLTPEELGGDRLIKKTKIKKILYDQLRSARFNYIVTSLNEHDIELNDAKDEEDFITKNSDAIRTMVCVTPNGVIRPKRETTCSFNAIHRALSKILEDLKIKSDKVRAPISIRIVTSEDDEKIKERPRANNKLHSDFWTGAVCDYAILIPIFGTLDTVDVVFGEAKDIKQDFLQELVNYSDGEKLYGKFDEYQTRMEKGYLFLQDIYCLHGTRRSGKGVRISLDFTLQSYDYENSIKKLYSNKTLSNDNHLYMKDWLKIGDEYLITEKESIKELIAENNYVDEKDQEKKGIAIKTQTSQSIKIVNQSSQKIEVEFAK